jgi:hypothetical protein
MTSTNPNLLISLSQYTGTATTVPYPGTLPDGAASVANGTYPNVFQNATADGSFGVTAPIFLDTVTSTGTLISAENLTQTVSSQLGKNITTSFSSKSELALNLTPTGTGVTFVAYLSPANALDVSNSNTPGYVDPTNPASSTVQRAIIQLDDEGNVVNITPIDAYSGNNGRAAVLGSNGLYYTVGNAGNGGFSLTGATTYISGSTTSGSSTVTVTNVAGLFVGEVITGNNIPTKNSSNKSITVTITSINASNNTITISANATTGGTDAALAVTTGAITTAGSNTVDASAVSTGITGISVGEIITGNNIPTTSTVTVVSVDTTNKTFTISANATASGVDPKAKIVASPSTLSLLSSDTGVQAIADTSTSGQTTVVGAQQGTTGASTGNQYGFSITALGDAADKTGKDDNFRGLTIGTDGSLYVSKGSGGNGVDTVYKVTASTGSLPTLANASTATISVLPGFPTGLATNQPGSLTAPSNTVYTPFGLWFANATTLYVGDEGSGAGINGTNATTATDLQAAAYDENAGQVELG